MSANNNGGINSNQATSVGSVTGSVLPWAAIPVLSVAAFASSLSLRVADPLLPRLSREFSVSLGEVASVITFFSLAYAIAQWLWGPLGDRFGKYRVIACAGAVCAFATLLCALSPNLEMLLLARLACGAAAAALVPLSMAWIGDVVPYGQRQAVLAKFMSGQVLGVASGAWLGGLAADHLSWRTPFFGIALLFGVISTMLFVFNRRLPADARTTRPPSGSALRQMGQDFAFVLSRPWARWVLVTVFLEGCSIFGAFAFIAVHLNAVHGLSLALAGSVAMLFGFGGLLFTGTAFALVPRLGEAGLSSAGGLIAGASLLLAALTPVWWWVMPACLLAGAGFYMLHNTLQTNATQMAPERRGAAMSAFASCFFLGQSFGVGVAGWVVQSVGTVWVIAAGAVGMGVVGVNFGVRLARRQAG